MSFTLTFYLREGSESDDEVLAGTRYELRKRYWTLALDLIRKAHEDTGTFSNVNPSKDNWISGYYGTSGFSICCVTNYDSARVEIVFSKANKEENKAMFDRLFARKVEIEQILGTTLAWARGDDIKASKVSYGRTNILIWMQYNQLFFADKYTILCIHYIWHFARNKV